METIGDRLKEIRMHYSLTQKDFAKKIGVTNAHISRMEKGITIPSEHLIMLICKEFEINIDWLKLGEDPMYAADSIGEKMEASIPILNKLLQSENIIIQNQAAELNMLFSKIINVEHLNDDAKMLYLNNISNLLSIVNKFTDSIKEDISTGQQTLKEIYDQRFSMYKNDLMNYVDELKRLFLLTAN